MTNARAKSRGFGPYLNVALYRFFPLNDGPEQRFRIRDRAVELGLKGTILLAPEGLNAFLAGKEAPLREFLTELQRIFPALTGVPVKESISEELPFTRMLVKLKSEIITMRRPEVNPALTPSRTLAPETLKTWLDQGRDLVLLDTRNDYEVKLGTFEAAITLPIRKFTEFPEKAQGLPKEWRKKTVVTFCTGGIRCEKAAPYLEKIGFEDVYQLDGGILNYFEKEGGNHYRDDCFVFDHRVALRADLSESTAKECFKCCLPVSLEEQKDPRYVPNLSCPACYREAPE